MKKTLVILLACVIVYQGVLWWTPYDSVLPSLLTLISDYFKLVSGLTWVSPLVYSVIHALMLLFGMALLSLIVVAISLYVPWVKHFVSQVSEWMAATPTIAILLIGLVLFGLTQSVNIIVSFIIWPLVLERMHFALTSLSDDEQDVLKVFPPTFIEEWIHIRLARVVEELGSMINMIFPTTLKILIMVEVLHSQTQGYGHLYQMARQYFMIERLFTLTFHLIIVLKILKTLTCYLFHKST